MTTRCRHTASATAARCSEVLSGADEWYEFDATLDCQVLLDASGVFDMLRAPERDIEGLTLRLCSPHPRWQQAFSADGGRTWEVDWVAEFSRTRTTAGQE